MKRRALLVGIWTVLAGFSLSSTQLRAETGGVLVFGGTGQLGSEIVTRLVARGEDVTVFVRPSSTRARLQGMSVSYAVGDLLSTEDVSAAISSKAYRAIIDATAKSTSSTADTFYETAMMNIIGPAKETGVGQIIHHGSVSAGENISMFPGLESQINADMLVRLNDKGRAETVLVNSGVPYTIIRNGFIDAGNPPATNRARMTEDQSVFGRITRADLAILTLDCLGQKSCLGKVYHAIDDALPMPLVPGVNSPENTSE